MTTDNNDVVVDFVVMLQLSVLPRDVAFVSFAVSELCFVVRSSYCLHFSALHFSFFVFLMHFLVCAPFIALHLLVFACLMHFVSFSFLNFAILSFCICYALLNLCIS